jgi:hypothetical protein
VDVRISAGRRGPRKAEKGRELAGANYRPRDRDLAASSGRTRSCWPSAEPPLVPAPSSPPMTFDVAPELVGRLAKRPGYWRDGSAWDGY